MPTVPAVAQGAASESQEDCSSGESKAAKRPRRAANAARELVQDIVANDSDSEAADEPPVKAKAAKKTATATPGGSGPRPKLPRPEGIACCPRCKSEDTKFCYHYHYTYHHHYHYHYHYRYLDLYQYHRFGSSLPILRLASVLPQASVGCAAG